jgi:hypothetical protein
MRFNPLARLASRLHPGRGLHRVCRAKRSRRGVSAVEFALIAPVMLLMLFGAAEASLAVAVDRKVTIGASTIGDLVAQEETLNCPMLQEMVKVTRQVFVPYDGGGAASIAVAQVVIDGGSPKVQWSKIVTSSGCSNAPSMPVGSTISIGGDPALVSNMIETGGAVIVGEVRLTHQPDLTSFFAQTIAMNERFFLRPRRSLQVCWDTNPGTVGCQP